MPLCITRVMWSALLINENEASGAWIDAIHMLMDKIIGTKQAKYNLWVYFRACLMDTFLYFPLVPSQVTHGTLDAPVLMHMQVSKEDELHCLKISVIKGTSFPARFRKAKLKNEEVILEWESQHKPIFPRVSSGGAGVPGHRSSLCHFMSEAEVKCKAHRSLGEVSS